MASACTVKAGIVHPYEIDVNMDHAKAGSQMIVGAIANKLDKLGLGDEWSVPSNTSMPPSLKSRD